MRLIRLAPVLVLLAACNPQAPDGSDAAAPADAPAEQGMTEAEAEPAPPSTPAPVIPAPFAGDLNALGTEPFWAVQIRAEQLTLTRPDEPDIVAPNPGPVVAGETAVWTAIRPEGPMTVTLTKGECSDGMSDRSYPMTAEVVFAGETLKGCATTPAALQAKPAP